jgi:hypothetical protein
MQTRMFQTLGWLAGVTLLLSALALPLGAKDKHQLTRTIKGIGHMTLTVRPTSPTTAIFHNDEVGNVTFTGAYHNVGDGEAIIDMQKGQFVPLSGHGTVTAANGDTIDWSMDDGLVILDGGTGRFGNASGSFAPVFLSQSGPCDNGDGSFTLYVDYRPEGEITF